MTHIIDARAARKLLKPEQRIEYLIMAHPWRKPHIDGRRFGDAMLIIKPRTVGEAEALGLMFDPPLFYHPLGHLSWWFTDVVNGAYRSLKIAGRFFDDGMESQEIGACEQVPLAPRV